MRAQVLLGAIGAILLVRTARAAPLILDGSGTVTCPSLAGVSAHPSGKGCIMGGVFDFDSISLTHGAIIEVAPYNGSSHTTRGNLVLRTTGSILVDESSRIVAKGAGYRAQMCNDGEGPSAFSFAGGRGGCAVLDSGGGGAHYGRGGKGTKDCFLYGNNKTCTFPQEWEEDCGNLNGAGTACVDVGTQSGGLSCYGTSATPIADGMGDALPDVAGKAFWHSLYQEEFGAAGGDKGCRDGFDNASRGGNGGGRIVLFAANATKTGNINILGRVSTDGFRGCASGNDSAGGGAGGTVLLVGDQVAVGPFARVTARGGRGGDSQPKGLVCTTDANCGGGQVCRTFTDPWAGTSGTQSGTYKRCDPSACTPCLPGDICSAGYTCVDIDGDFDGSNGNDKICLPTPRTTAPNCPTAGLGNCDPDGAGSLGATAGDCIDLGAAVGRRCITVNTPVCDVIEYADNEEECRATQNSGTCDDCAGGGGGGIVAVQSRSSNIDPRAIFDVRGGQGGICPICAGEAGAGAGELQIDQGYVGEVCDGWDNNFNGSTDENLGTVDCPTQPEADTDCMLCPDGSVIRACSGGVPGTCPTVTGCNGPVTDTRPRFAVVVDTSGSMLLDQNGFPTFGDGSAGHAGLPGNTSRLFMAKNALANVVASFPESDYALGRYYQDVGVNRSCQTASWFECAKSCCTYDDPRNNVAPTYQLWYPEGKCVLSDLYPTVGSATSPLTSLTSNINVGWPNKTDCINYAGSCGLPQRGAQFLVDFGAPLDHHLMWLDHGETNFKSTIDCAGGDCELRATGPTPLAASLDAARAFLAPRANCDRAKACRKYSVVLLTDGAESCQGDPSASAAALLAGTGGVSVKTYVVGFSVQQEEKAQLNQIAVAGGTKNAYFVANENDLFNALAGIVSSSYVFESCNDLDDDCDGLIDEGLGVYQECTAPGQCSSGTCNAGRCTCTTDAQCAADYACSADGFCRPACATGTGECRNGGVKKCGATPTQCCAKGGGPTCNALTAKAAGTETCNNLDDDCDGLVDEGLSCSTCIPVQEVCNGVDDDCDTLIDALDPDLIGEQKDCGLAIGRCTPGKTVCVKGQLECQNAQGPFPEICNGFDDNCDGVRDGMTRECYSADPATRGVGICRAGTEACVSAVGTGVENWGTCIGQVAPTSEHCNGLDDDCDGTVDEGVADRTGKLTGEACCPLGVQCGVGVCKAGVLACTGTDVQCVGAQGPSNESCNGLDDDCNGKTDDLPGVGASCLTDGGCQGAFGCDATTGGLICNATGAVNPEICDGVDNDCDGRVDEEPDVSANDPSLGQVCNAPVAPADQPPCKAGVTTCIEGQVQCDGSVKPQAEICDLRDNDCDGVADQAASCPTAGNACLQGQCLEPCHTGEFPCPGGFFCAETGYCQPSSCIGVLCPSGATCNGGRCTLSGTGGSDPGASGGASGNPGTGGENASGSGGVGGLSSTTGGQQPTAGTAAVGATEAGGLGPAPGPTEPTDPGVYGLATGGGGCACSVPEVNPRPGLWGLVVGIGLAVVRRRRREVVR